MIDASDGNQVRGDPRRAVGPSGGVAAIPGARTEAWAAAIPDRTILSGIVYRLRTGSQWKALPDQFGSGSTCHARFQAWSKAGLFRRLFEKLVEFYDDVRGIQWEWASLDSALVKAPKGGDATGPNPTDRGKSGVKRHILSDGRGVPLSAEITAASVHDKRAAIPTVDAVVVRAPRGPRRPTNLCLDKGYDFDDIDREIRARGIRPHIVDEARSRGAADGGEPDAGSWSEPTPGTTGFEPCSFAGSEGPPTTWLFSISRAHDRASPHDVTSRCFAVLIEAVRIATSSFASPIKVVRSSPTRSVASSVNRSQQWMKSARLSAPRASS